MNAEAATSPDDERWLVTRPRGLHSTVPVSILIAFRSGQLSSPLLVQTRWHRTSRCSPEPSRGPALSTRSSELFPLLQWRLPSLCRSRAGVFNLGGEGQMVLGGLAGTVVAISAPGPGFAVLLLALAAGVVAGALRAVPAAVLDNRLGVPISITTLLLRSTQPATFVSYLVRFPFERGGFESGCD